MFGKELIQTGFLKDSGIEEILNTVFDKELIQTGFHKDGRLQEILDTVFDKKLIQTISTMWLVMMSLIFFLSE